MASVDQKSKRAARAGAVAGAVAWLVGYLTVYLTQSGAVEERLQEFNLVIELFSGDPIPSWQAVGWFYYNAHFVETNIPVLGSTINRNFVPMEGSSLLLYLIAPIVLLLAGFTIAYLLESEMSDSGPMLGSLVALGYLPLSFLGVFVFGFDVGSGTIAPDPITGILLAGFVYPLVFGAIGGLLGGEI